MRKYNFIMVMFILLCSCSAKSWGQDIVNLNHIVQRGETIEILANKYRLTTDILKAKYPKEIQNAYLKAGEKMTVTDSAYAGTQRG